MAESRHSTRRSFLKGFTVVAAAVPASAALADNDRIDALMKASVEDQTRYIMGSYAMMTRAERVEFQKELGAIGLPDLAEAFAREFC